MVLEVNCTVCTRAWRIALSVIILSLISCMTWQWPCKHPGTESGLALPYLLEEFPSVPLRGPCLLLCVFVVTGAALLVCSSLVLGVSYWHHFAALHSLKLLHHVCHC